MRRVALWVLVVLAVLWGISLATVAYHARHDAARAADAIGRPSPVLKARLDHAALLFRRRLAPLILVTGGTGTGDTQSEAEVARRYLLEIGLPAAAVHADTAGRTSEASLRDVALGRPAGQRRVILVSDGFHMLRLNILARRFGLTPFGSPAPLSPIRRSRRTEAMYLLAESIKAPVAFLVTRAE
jgi:uncharacterized SAM-binding protein YcdF (DUF218 family)